MNTVKTGAFKKERQLKLTEHKNPVRPSGLGSRGSRPGDAGLEAALLYITTARGESDTFFYQSGIPLLTAASRASLSLQHLL